MLQGRILLGVVHVSHEFLIGHLQDHVLDIPGCEDVRRRSMTLIDGKVILR
jgi:hypothetical protein